MASVTPDKASSSMSRWPDLIFSLVEEAVWPRELAVSLALVVVLSAVEVAWSPVGCVASEALFAAMISWSFSIAVVLEVSLDAVSLDAVSLDAVSVSAAAVFSDPCRYVPAFSSTVPIWRVGLVE